MAKIAKIKPSKTGPLDVVERRAAPRGEVEVPVRIKATKVGSVVNGRAVNISRTGVFIATKNPPPIGTVIDLEIDYRDGRLMMHATAKIMRHQESPSGFGAHFTNVSYESQELIDEIVAQGEPA